MTRTVRRFTVVVAAIAVLLGSFACAPEVGSDGWCEQMNDKSKGDWSANDAASYAKHCVFK